MLPSLTVAVKMVALPRAVGPLLAATSPTMGRSCTVIVTVSGVLVTSPRLSVTVRVKVITAGVAGAVNDGCATVTSLKLTAGSPLCTQP